MLRPALAVLVVLAITTTLTPPASAANTLHVTIEVFQSLNPDGTFTVAVSGIFTNSPGRPIPTTADISGLLNGTASVSSSGHFSYSEVVEPPANGYVVVKGTADNQTASASKYVDADPFP